MDDTPLSYAFLCASALLAGAVNAVAGGGTLLTFPALMGVLREDGVAANGTSTVALLLGSAAGVWGYRQEVVAARRHIYRLAPPSVAGGVLGVMLVIAHPSEFNALVPWLILTAAALFLLQRPLARRLRATSEDGPATPRVVAGVVMAQFVIATYGGYFGAGIGILMLGTLGFMGLRDIYQINGVKNALATIINTATAVVFIAQGVVAWRYVGPMAAASVAGGFLGAKYSRRLPPAYVRTAVVAIGFTLAAYYFARRG